MLGLRLDEPLSLAGLEQVVDADELERLERLGLAEPRRRRRCALTTRAAASSATAVTAPRSAAPDAPPTMVEMSILLSERQREILRLVVEEYVATGQPVGSKTLVERRRSRRCRRRPCATSWPSSSGSGC